MLLELIKRKWAEISTRFGLMLGVISTAALQFAPMKPDLAYVGLAASALLVWFKEQPGG